MSGPNRRLPPLEGWQRRLVEQEIGDSKRLPRDSFAAAANVRLEETGGVTGRAGLVPRTVGAAVAIGLPAANYAVALFSSPAITALVASNGSSIRVLEAAGWTAIGAFPTAGTRASFAFIAGRLYAANGIDVPRVIDRIAAAWNVRAAGVAAPTAAPVVTGSGTAYHFYHSFSWIDGRGFESNESPPFYWSGGTVTTFTMTLPAVIPANVTAVNIYSSLRDQRERFLVGTRTAVAAATFQYDTLNINRNTRYAAPIDHDPPPAGVYSLGAHENRLFALRGGNYPGYQNYSAAGEPEYWPLGFSHDLTVLGDASEAVNYGWGAGGLEPWKGTAALLVEGDPENAVAARPLVSAAGLVHADGICSLNGLAAAVTQRGIVAHDGVAELPIELWRRVKRSSDFAAAAARVVAAAHDTRMSFFFRDPDDSALIAQLTYDRERDGWLKDRLGVKVAAGEVIDETRDFAADTGTHESAEVGLQTIATGGGSATITLTGGAGPKVVAGAAIKFDGVATVYMILAAAAALILDQGAPADGTAVEWIRGTVVRDGALTMYGAAA